MKNDRKKENERIILNDGELVPQPTPMDDVYLSNIMLHSKRRISKYGERLLIDTIFAAKEYILNAALKRDEISFSEVYHKKFATIDIPTKRLLDEDDTSNYTKAKAAVVELMQIYHQIETPVLDDKGDQLTYKNGAPQYQFSAYHLIDRVDINKKPGIISVRLGEDTWSRILDMGKGYSRYNYFEAKSLSNTAAIRLFQLLSGSDKPVYFALDDLKSFFGLQDKYKDHPSNFFLKIIVPAEQEISKKCLFTVTHKLEYGIIPEKKRPVITGATFTKITGPNKDIITNLLGKDLLNMLINDFGFTFSGIKSNLNLFLQMQQEGYDVIDYLKQIMPYAQRANKTPNYVVICIKNLLAEPSSTEHLSGTSHQAGPVSRQEPQAEPPADKAQTLTGPADKSAHPRKPTKKNTPVAEKEDFLAMDGLEEI